MSQKKLRQHIASEAARLMCEPGQPGYDQAKREALRQFKTDRLRPQDFPTNLEIREEIVALAEVRQAKQLQAMRREALRMMHVLHRFHPRLVGSVLSGPVSASSAIELEVFGDEVESVIAAIGGHGETHPLGPRQIRKNDQLHKADCIHLQSAYPFRLMVFVPELFESFSTDLQCEEVVDHANSKQLAEMLAATERDVPAVPEPPLELENRADRFEIYAILLWPLEEVMQNSKSHPEGDALYHSLQVYEQARDQFPYDEEFLLAALLHDVGKAIDPNDPVGATLVALEGWITERTAWFIEHQFQAAAYLDHELGARARKRLEASADFEQLLSLVQCDRAGREQGVTVPDVSEVLVQVRDLAASFDGDAATEGEQNE